MEEITYKGIENLKAIKYLSYKSFLSDDKPFEIRTDKYMTLIIGRNNCGKSSLVDIIERVIGPDNENGWEYFSEDIKDPEYVYQIDESHLGKGFTEQSDRVSYSGIEKYVGSTLSLQFSRNKVNLLLGDIVTDAPGGTGTKDRGMKAKWDKVVLRYKRELQNVCFRRINADRDIVPETENESEAVAPNGRGATNLLRKFIHVAKCEEKLVEKTILEELNKLVRPETTFTRLQVLEIDEYDSGKRKWELFLEEGDKRFALSKSGSGLKTLLLILVNLYLVPHVINSRNEKKQEIVYAFEEVENNLHPALQRRLFDYLYWYAVTNRIKIFITSHSHIAINTYYQLKEAQIYHVTKNGGKSKLELSLGKPDLIDMLNDLNVKASDENDVEEISRRLGGGENRIKSATKEFIYNIKQLIYGNTNLLETVTEIKGFAWGGDAEGTVGEVNERFCKVKRCENGVNVAFKLSPGGPKDEQKEKPDFGAFLLFRDTLNMDAFLSLSKNARLSFELDCFTNSFNMFTVEFKTESNNEKVIVGEKTFTVEKECATYEVPLSIIGGENARRAISEINFIILSN